MRSYLKYLSILVPLAVLLSLPCATKRQLKEAAGIPKIELAANKGENAKFCISTFFQKEQVQHSLKRLILDAPTGSFTSIVPLISSAIKRTIDVGDPNDKVSVLPLFLLYGKLIIYF